MPVGALVTPVVYSTLHFYTISRPNSLIFRQNFFQKNSNGKSWVKNLQGEAQQWLADRDVSSGYIFLNRYGERISKRGIAIQLKHFADMYGLNREVVYPHSFRHRFAKNFLDKFNDLALLADLMGHESIETTRIYLRRTATEQRQIVDKVVTW